MEVPASGLGSEASECPYCCIPWVEAGVENTQIPDEGNQAPPLDSGAARAHEAGSQSPVCAEQLLQSRQPVSCTMAFPRCPVPACKVKGQGLGDLPEHTPASRCPVAKPVPVR